MGHSTNHTSSLGSASTECPECGEEFRLSNTFDDQKYVRHLEGHLEDGSA